MSASCPPHSQEAPGHLSASFSRLCRSDGMCTLFVLVLALTIVNAWCATMVPPPAVVQIGLGGLAGALGATVARQGHQAALARRRRAAGQGIGPAPASQPTQLSHRSGF